MKYTNEFYLEQKDGSLRGAKKILPLVLEACKKVPITSIADFGCGCGTWLKVADELGIQDYIGCDFGDNEKQLLIEKNKFIKKNLTKSIDLGRKFSLVMSLEVAEHLPEESALEFIETLCRHGNIVLFSAAPIGQTGVGHINEQFLSYWVNMFNCFDYKLLDIVRPCIYDDKSIPFWYRQNAVLFVSSKIQQTILIPHNSKMIDVISPEMYKFYLDFYEKYNHVIKNPLIQTFAKIYNFMNKKSVIDFK